MRSRTLAFLFVFLASLFTSSPSFASHGEVLIPQYWSDVREEYPILPPVRVSRDFQGGSAEATFGGFDPDGYANVAYNSYYYIDYSVVWHEAGHAYEGAILLKGMSFDELFDRFWAVRRFPGTWQEAFQRAQDAKNDPSLSSFQRWRLQPNEMWAEAFKAANLSMTERTENYGVPFNHYLMKEFFKSLMKEPVLSYVSDPFPVRTDTRGNADLTVPIYGLRPYEPTVVLVQRVGTTGEEGIVPGLIGQSEDGFRATVRVRGDFVMGGTIWLQIAAMQGLSISNPFPVWTDAKGNADVYGVTLTGTTRGLPTTVIVQRVGTTGEEAVVPGLLGQSTDGVTATVRVRGDYVKGGFIWLQRMAVQRYGSYPFPLRTDSRGNVDWPYLHISRAPGQPTLVLALRVGTTGVEDVVPGLMAQWGNDGMTTIRVRGDYVKGGVIWMQYFAIQSNYGYQPRSYQPSGIPGIGITE